MLFEILLKYPDLELMCTEISYSLWHSNPCYFILIFKHDSCFFSNYAKQLYYCILFNFLANLNDCIQHDSLQFDTQDQS